MDVAGGQFDRTLDRLGGVFEPVIILEGGLQALEDLDRVRNGRLVHINLLEAADERPSFSKCWRNSL